MASAQELPADLTGWGPNTRFFGLDDGRYVVIMADLYESDPEARIVFIPSPTVALLANENARPEDLTPDWQFAPGTTHEDALQQMGFPLTSGS